MVDFAQVAQRLWQVVTDYSQPQFWLYWGLLVIYVVRRSLADRALAREIARCRSASPPAEKEVFGERID
ncbi:hypothetical protein D3C78_666550 [compost metagenome]